MLKIGGIYVPGEHRTLDCMVPGCGAKFLEHQRVRWEQHVVRCSEEHREKVIAQSVRNRAPDIFDPLSDTYNGDVDLDRWIRQNRQAIIEERLRM